MCGSAFPSRISQGVGPGSGLVRGRGWLTCDDGVAGPGAPSVLGDGDLYLRILPRQRRGAAALSRRTGPDPGPATGSERWARERLIHTRGAGTGHGRAAGGVGSAAAGGGARRPRGTGRGEVAAWDRDPKGRDPAGGSGRPRSGRVEPGPREAGSRPNRTPGGKGLEEKTVGEGAGHRLRYCQNSSGTWAAQYQVPDALFAGSTPAPNPPQRPQTAQ